MIILILNFSRSHSISERDRHTIDLVAMLEKRGHQLFLLSSNTHLLKAFDNDHLPRQRLPRIVTPLLPFALLWYRFRRRANVLYCQTSMDKCCATLPAWLLGFKVLWLETPEQYPSFFAILLRPLLRLLRRYATIITVSRNMQKKLEEKNKGVTAVHVVPPTVTQEATRWQETIFTTIAEREHPKFYKQQFCIGTVAPLTKASGLEYLLRAIATVREVVPAIRCILVGGGTARKQLEWLAERLHIEQNVLFVGGHEMSARWVTHFDILVLPFLESTAFGYVVLEAMLQQKPIIATRVGSMADSIIPSKTGVLLEPKNAEMLAEAILNLYHHPEWREEMGRLGKERVEKHFHPDHMVEAFERALLS